MAKKKLNYKFQGSGLNKEAKKWAKKRFEEYIEHYHFEKLSNLQLLEELVFREALQEQYKKDIEVVHDSKTVKANNIIPTKLIGEMDENLEQILKLKEKLGLFEEKKKEDPLKHLKQLKKKFEIWREENKGTREVVCPFCSELFYLMIRTEKYFPSKTPFFKDKILANKELWGVYKSGQPITKDQMSKVLGVSPDYIDWLEKKIFPSN